MVCLFFSSLGHKEGVFRVLCLLRSKYRQWCLLWSDGQKCMENIVNVVLFYCLFKVSFIQFLVDLEPVSLSNDLQNMKGIWNVMQILKQIIKLRWPFESECLESSYNLQYGELYISTHKWQIIIFCHHCCWDPLQTLS